MNGSAENKASSAFQKSRRPAPRAALATARSMLPLVQRIVADILSSHSKTRELTPALDRLDRQRRSLAWPERQRRYQIRDEISTAERTRREAEEELSSLGLVLEDGSAGQVGFPTVVQGNSALLSWRPGDHTVEFWHYVGETERRRVLDQWDRQEPKPATLRS